MNLDKETKKQIIQKVLDTVDDAWWTEDGRLMIRKDGKEVEVDVRASMEFDIPGLTEATGHRLHVPPPVPIPFSMPSRKRRDLPYDKSYLRKKGRKR